MRTTIVLSAALVCIIFSSWAPATASTADLLDALDNNTVAAEFRGTGGAGVEAYLERLPGGPDYVTVSPGTQFWAQRGGLQGQSTLGWVPIRLGPDGVAHVHIPTACTNIDRPAPTADDRLWPEPCPDARMARLCSTLRPDKQPEAAMQLAVWAIANNPSRRQLRSHEADLVGENVEPANRQAAFEGLLYRAAALMDDAGLRPQRYRMFRGSNLDD